VDRLEFSIIEDCFLERFNIIVVSEQNKELVRAYWDSLKESVLDRADENGTTIVEDIKKYIKPRHRSDDKKITLMFLFS
jgi:hypothetical protein